MSRPETSEMLSGKQEEKKKMQRKGSSKYLDPRDLEDELEPVPQPPRPKKVKFSEAKHLGPKQAEPGEEDNDVEVIARIREVFCSKWLGNKKLRELEEETGLKYKRGKFSDLERQIVNDTIESFIREESIEREEFIEKYVIEQRGANSKGSVNIFQRIAQQLDGRPINAIYHFVRRQMHPGNHQGEWSAEEDRELRRLQAVHGSNWAEIGRAMGRYSVNCRDRFRMISKSVKKGPWSQEETDRLLEAIDLVRAGKLSRSEGDVWEVIASQVETRNANQCLSRWYEVLDIQLRTAKGDKEPHRWSHSDDLMLCEALWQSGVEHETEVEWRLILDCCPSLRDRFTVKRLRDRWRILRKRVWVDGQSMDTTLQTLMNLLSPLSPNSHHSSMQPLEGSIKED